MPFKRTDGFAGRPFTPKLGCAEAGALGRGALNSLFVEHLLAAGADLALDVIRNPGTLPDGMNRDSAVLVSLEGHSVSSG
jgi:hypothetical protein